MRCNVITDVKARKSLLLEGQIQSPDLVQLCVQGMTSETYLYVNAYAVPICSPLQNQAVNFAASTYQHLSGLLLADSISADKYENIAEVDVLIGADYYWHFLTGGIKRGESGPTALQTKVGWALSGPVQGGSALNSMQVISRTLTHYVWTLIINSWMKVPKTGP